MFNFEKTNYPKIFKKIYWGRFQNDTDNCCKARDEFVKKYGIESVFTGSYPLPLRLDHNEVYRCADASLVMVYSPYFVDEKLAAFNDTHDFTAMKETLYAVGVVTYIKKFINLKDFRHWEKSVVGSKRYLLGW